MELDELKAAWAEYDRKLDGIIRMNERLLRAPKLSRAAKAMRRFAVSRGVEAVVTLAVIGAFGSFIYDHAAAMRFVWPAVGLDVGAIAILSSSIRQMLAAMAIDYDEPVAAVQRQVELVRIMRIQHVRNVVLLAPLAWVPLLIVALQAFLGLDAYRVFSGAWMVSNVALGVAVIPLGLWLSRKFGKRMGRYPAIRRFMNDLAGINLSAARRALGAISEFEKS